MLALHPCGHRPVRRRAGLCGEAQEIEMQVEEMIFGLHSFMFRLILGIGRDMGLVEHRGIRGETPFV